jgi:rhamnose transport system permease protein
MARHRPERTLAGIIAAVGAVLGFAAPTFFVPSNLSDLFLANLPVLIAALGATLVILTGEIDISVGSLFAVSSVFAGVLAVAGVPMPLVALATLALGALAGAGTGILVVFARIPSIVVTLAAMVVLRDGLRWITQGAWVQDLPPAFQWFGLPQAAYPMVMAVLAIVLTMTVVGLLGHTHAGRSIYVTGSNAEAARLAGLDSAMVRLWVFAAAGALTALAAIVNAVRFNQIPSNTGLGLELKVIAAVVVGGTAITGGRGSVLGTVLGVVLLGISGPALVFLGASPYWERALQGAIILAAVASEAFRRRPWIRRSAAAEGRS